MAKRKPKRNQATGAPASPDKAARQAASERNRRAERIAAARPAAVLAAAATDRGQRALHRVLHLLNAGVGELVGDAAGGAGDDQAACGGGGAARVDVLPHVSGDRDHGVSV